MKKYYLAPTINVVKLQTVGMLATSVDVDGNPQLKDNGNSGNASSGLSRSFDFDED